MWNKRKPVYGDQIRVNRGFYYHHGIYEDDNHVYHYSAIEGSEISPENAMIIVTDLKTFLNGGALEARDYNEYEIERLKPKDEIVNRAKNLLGTGLGEYSIINNNCERFSNYCAFGVKESNQVRDAIKMLFGGR